MPFWGPQRDSEGPRGPDLVPTAADWSDWVRIMVTTHFGLVSGLFWAPSGPKRAHLGPKCPLLAPKGPKIGTKFNIVSNISCYLSKFAQEGHSFNENNIVPIGFTS